MADFEKKTTLITVDIDQEASEKAVDSLTNAIIDQKTAIQDNNKTIKELNSTNKELEKQVKSGVISQESANKQIIDNNNKVKELTKTNFSLKDELKDLNAERVRAVKTAKLESGTLDALRTKVAAQKKELNSLNITTEEGQKRFEALSKEIKINNDFISEADKGAGDYKTTIGRYREEVGKAIKDQGGFGAAIQESNTKVGSAAKTVSSFFKLLLTNPVVLIVSALTALFAAFTKTEKGTRLLAKATGFINGLMSELIGVVDDLADFLTSAFENPQQAIKDFGDFIVQNIVNRFKAVLDLGGALSDVIGNLLSGNLSKAKKAAKEAGTAFIQLNTGLDEKQQKQFADSLLNTAESALKTADAFSKLAASQIDVARANRESELSAAKLGAEEERLIQIRDDDTRSFEEREKAGLKVFELTKQRAEQENQIALRNQNLVSQELALRQSNGESVEDLLDKKLEADKAVIESQKELTLSLLESEEAQALLKRDIFEQDLDFAIDVGTRRTEEALRAAENEKASIEDRQASLNEARKLDEEAFNNQLRLFEQVGLSREKINLLVNESNASVINSELKKTKLSEIERNRFRELVLERQGLTEGINDTEKALEEAREERAMKLIEDQRKLNDSLFALEQFRREQKNESLLEEAESDEERFELRIEQQQERFEVEQEQLAEQKAIALEGEIENEEERLAIIADFKLREEQIISENKNKLADIREKADNEEIKKEKEKRKLLGQLLEAGLSSASTITNAFYASSESRLEKNSNKEISDLNKKFNAGIISSEEHAKQRENIDKRNAEKSFQIQRKQFIANKVLTLVDIAVNTAKGVGQALGSFPPPASFIMAGLVGAAGIAQGIAVAKEQPPTPPGFAEGGDVLGFKVGGNYHSAGGTKYAGEDGNMFEVEKDEGIFVTKRSATNKALMAISDINKSHGGKSMFSTPRQFLQEGGSVISNQGLTEQQISTIVAQTAETLPAPEVRVTDIMGGLESNQNAKQTGII